MSTGPPPWPRVTPEQLAVARHGLVEPPAPGWLGHVDWPELREGCVGHGLLGLLVEAVAAGARDLDPEQRAGLADRIADSLAVDVQLERALLEVTQILEAHAVPFRVLKGLANAHLDYADPALRSFRDVDLAVPVPHVEVAQAALEGEGYGMRSPIRRGPVEFRFEKGITYRSPRGHEIDVHRVLISGPFGECWDPQSMFEDAETFSIGGRTLPALNRPGRMVHACIAATIGDPVPRVRPARDVAQILSDPRLDDDQVVDLARTWGTAALVARAIRMAVDGLDLPIRRPLVSWASTYRSTPRDRLRLALFTRAPGGVGLRALGSGIEMSGVVERSAFVRYCIQNRPLPHSS